MKIRLLISSLLLAFCVTWLPVNAEINVEPIHRVRNRGYGVCAWSSIEMAGRKLQIDAVKGLAKQRDAESKKKVKKWERQIINGRIVMVVVEEELRNNGGSVASMRRQLDDLKVKYESQLEGSYNTDLLFRGTKDSEGGVIVGIYNYSYTPPTEQIDGCWKYIMPKANSNTGYHAVLLTHIDDKTVKFVDPNDISAPWMAPRSWFNKHWDGAALLLIKPPVRENENRVEITQKEVINKDSVYSPHGADMTEEDKARLIERLITDPKKKKK